MEEALRELNPYLCGISLDELDHIFEGQAFVKEQHIVKVVSKNGRLSYESYLPDGVVKFRFGRLLILLNQFVKSKSIPGTFKLLASMHDSFSMDMPIFTAAKTCHAKSILMPDFFVQQGMQSFQQDHEQIPDLVRKGNTLYPWGKKKNKAIWRGVTTARWIHNRYPDCLKSPRVSLVHASMHQPELIDAGFTKYVQFENEEEQKAFAKQYPLKHPVSLPDQIAYKYIIDIDGNTCNDSRWFWGFHSNSLVIKQNSDQIFWFSNRFKKNTHYLGFKSDLSDFVDVINWAITHDEECLSISLRSSEIAKVTYDLREQKKYFTDILCRYIDLLY